MKSGLLILVSLGYICFISYLVGNAKPLHALYDRKVKGFFTEDNRKVVSVTREPEYKERKAKVDEEPLSNSRFEYKPKEFEIDDSELIRGMRLVCEPTSFGYSVEKGNEVFPHHGYPKCSEVTGQNDTYLHIDRERNLLYMDCPDKNNLFLTGPQSDKKIILRKEGHRDWKIKEYSKPVDAKNIEFGLGSCEFDGKNFVQGYMSPIFNESAYKSALLKIQTKPKIVYFLTIDSMSRRHFFRKTPKIIEFLNSLNKNSNFSVFDFKLHNNHAENSPKNQVPIFSGTSSFPTFDIDDKNHDLLGDKALWNMLRTKGYINLLAFEDCDGSFVNYFGSYPDVEYSVGAFYCAVEKHSSYSFEKKAKTNQRCLGGHMSHYYILNYTDNVVDLNLGVNQMLYVHLSAAHEYTGNHAETLNEDIQEYLANFLQKYESQYEILIFLQADHGMKYGEFFRNIDAYQENKLPGFFLIGSKSLLMKFDKSFHSLATNTQRLVSKIDYRRTVLEMEGLEDSNKAAINLMSQISSKSRTCDDIGIKAWDCSCMNMVQLNKTTEKVDRVIRTLKDYAENLINSESYAFKKYPLGAICKKVKLGKIRKIYQTAISNVHEMFKLQIESDTKEGVVFEITFVMANGGKYVTSSRTQFRPESFTFGGYPMKTRALTVTRLDSYAGPCEIIANNKGIRPEMCLCQDEVN